MQRILSNAHVKFSIWHLDSAILDLAKRGEGNASLFIHASPGWLISHPAGPTPKRGLPTPAM
jgi:hypothetical protein